MSKLKNCPWCGIGEARPENEAPWDETGYTHCLNPDCVSRDCNGTYQRLPIYLWELLSREVLETGAQVQLSQIKDRLTELIQAFNPPIPEQGEPYLLACIKEILEELND